MSAEALTAEQQAALDAVAGIEDDLETEDAESSEEEETEEVDETPILETLAMDEPIYDGGPTREQVEAWKQQYPTSKILAIIFTDGDGVTYRTLNRLEWRALQQSTAKLKDTNVRDEVLFSKIALHPDCTDRTVINTLPAGYVMSTVQDFYLHAGFQPAMGSIKL